LIPLKVHEEVLGKIEGDHLHIAKKFLNGYTSRLRKFGMDMVKFSQTTGNECYPEPTEEAERILTSEERELLEEDNDLMDILMGWIEQYQGEIKKITKHRSEDAYIEEIHF